MTQLFCSKKKKLFTKRKFIDELVDFCKPVKSLNQLRSDLSRIISKKSQKKPYRLLELTRAGWNDNVVVTG